MFVFWEFRTYGLYYFACLDWIKIQPYNISRAFGSFLCLDWINPEASGQAYNIGRTFGSFLFKAFALSFLLPQQTIRF
jgi:hypothetical protein